MSIPKIIHYAWFSGDPWEEIHKKCFESWNSVLADYQFMKWDMTHVVKSKFFNKMIQQKKWAFAADYIRLHSLARFGGIYLDLDVEVIQKFDFLLQNHCVLGREDEQTLACHFIASEKEHPFILDCLKYYDKSLKLKLGNPPTMPRIVTKVARKYGLRKSNNNQKLNHNVTVYSSQYFSPMHYKDRLSDNPEQYIAKETLCIHYWSHSWSWSGSGSIWKHIKNQPWLYMGLLDWKRFLYQLSSEIKNKLFLKK